MLPRPRTIFAAAAASALLGLTGGAGAADGDPYLKSCYSTVATTSCTQLQPAFAATDVELSADGRHLYAAVGQQGGSGYSGVRLFEVGTGGALTARPNPAATTSEAPLDLDLSGDGRNVYASAGDRLIVYQRDATTGALVQIQCFGPPPCLSVPTTFASAALTGDGRSLYARGPNHVVAFTRNADGTLATAGCLAEDTAAATCAGAVGIAGSSLETAVSPDGRHLYVANDAPGGVAVFARDTSGALTQLPGAAGGCVTVGGTSGSAGGVECAAGPATLAEGRAANVDAQGSFVLVSAAGGNTVFRRDPATGRLTVTDCVDEVGGGPPPTGCREVKGATGGDAAVSPDGRNVALNAGDVGLSSFTLNRESGKLGQRPRRGCFSPAAVAPCEHIEGLGGGVGAVTFSGDGRHLFAAFRGGAVAAFETDVAPTCASRSISVRRNTTVLVPLACTDANGDEVRFEIAAPPANGTLGVVDQKRKRVKYTPEVNYRGRDVFRYRGVARGTRGAPAVVRVTVLRSGRRIDESPPNTRIRRGPPPTTASDTAEFRFTATERGSRFECKLDKARWTGCRSPQRYRAVTRGRHTFQVRAVDRAGNIDLSPAKRIWIRSR